jgi:hypothetical protein
MLGRVSKPRLRLATLRYALSGVFAAFAVVPQTAAAQDDPPFLLLEPTEYTDVLDAFDGEDDPFDFAVRLSFMRSQEDAVIERERSTAGAFEVVRLPVADYHKVSSALVLAAEVGLYKDLMVFGRLPLVFSDTRELALPEAASCGSAVCRNRERKIQQALDDTPPDAPDASRLFELGERGTARTRSGVPAVDVGVAWGITNQYRSPGLPTWVVLAESRISVGAPMRACISGNPCDPGTSRGTFRLQLGTRWSYRYRFVEPYLGFDHAFEWATGASDAFEPGGEGPHLVETGLPTVTGLTAGGSIVPWEHRGRFQQFSIDVRARAEYVSAGRDYTPLFDVLGASSNPYLDTPLPRDTGRPIAFNGLTQVSAYARLGLDLALAMQAARYVKFRVSLMLSHATRHSLTGAGPCTGARRTSGDSTDACGDETPNALYRGVIDQPGQRFWQVGQLAYSLAATATAQF